MKTIVSLITLVFYSFVLHPYCIAQQKGDEPITDINQILNDPNLTLSEVDDFGVPVVVTFYRTFANDATRYPAMHAEFQRLAKAAIEANDNIREVWTTDVVIQDLPEMIEDAIPGHTLRIDSMIKLLNDSIQEWAVHPLGRDTEPSHDNMRRVRDNATKLLPVCRQLLGSDPIGIKENGQVYVKGTGGAIALRGPSLEAFVKLNAVMKDQEKHGAALVAYWNDEFSKVAAAYHVRRYIKQAVMRAKNPGARKEIEDRDRLVDDLKTLRRDRDSVLQRLVNDPDSLDVEAAESLKAVAGKIVRKKEELEKAENAIKKAEQQMQGWLREILD